MNQQGWCTLEESWGLSVSRALVCFGKVEIEKRYYFEEFENECCTFSSLNCERKIVDTWCPLMSSLWNVGTGCFVGWTVVTLPVQKMATWVSRRRRLLTGNIGHREQVVWDGLQTFVWILRCHAMCARLFNSIVDTAVPRTVCKKVGVIMPQQLIIIQAGRQGWNSEHPLSDLGKVHFSWTKQGRWYKTLTRVIERSRSCL